METDRSSRDGGDVCIPGGRFLLGAKRDQNSNSIVFDCEKWEHPVLIRPFRMAKHCVTNRQFAAFVDGGGYSQLAHWGHEGRRWLRESQAKHPWSWSRAADKKTAASARAGTESSTGGGGWQLQWFERIIPLPANWPVCHITWYEADAYCRILYGDS